MRVPALITLFVGGCCLGLQACGGGSGGASSLGSIAPPSKPLPAECDVKAVASSNRAQPPSPRPGVYRYRLRGTETRVGDERRTRSLPTSMPVIVTSPRHAKGLSCFRLQRRLRPSLVETATIALDGDALYLTEIALETSARETLLAPQPPLLGVPPSGLEWSGVFGGQTRGRYRGRVIGRRKLAVGRKRVLAVGVAVESAFAGSVTGTQRSVQWFSTDEYLLLSERDEERRRVGLDQLLIKYAAELQSTTPKSGRSNE